MPWGVPQICPVENLTCSLYGQAQHQQSWVCTGCVTSVHSSIWESGGKERPSLFRAYGDRSQGRHGRGLCSETSLTAGLLGFIAETLSVLTIFEHFVLPTTLIRATIKYVFLLLLTDSSHFASVLLPLCFTFTVMSSSDVRRRIPIWPRSMKEIKSPNILFIGRIGKWL